MSEARAHETSEERIVVGHANGNAKRETRVRVRCLHRRVKGYNHMDTIVSGSEKRDNFVQLLALFKLSPFQSSKGFRLHTWFMGTSGLLLHV